MAKRALDVVLSALLLAILSPLILAIAVAVRTALGSPVLFRQWRPGLHGRPFLLLKFRTMRNAVDEGGAPLPDSRRLTGFGRLLRKTSMDELPELLNVLRGEMSLVGPRPLLMEYLPLYSEVQAKRHDVRPGITGWAQVNGRNTLSWEEKFAMDLWYVHNASMALDLRILWLTVVAVARGEGVTQHDRATTDPFRGSRQ